MPLKRITATILLLAGCATASVVRDRPSIPSALPAFSERELLSIANEYVRETKQWKASEYRLEHRPDKNDTNVVWMIYLAEERDVEESARRGLMNVGTPNSAILEIDASQRRVVRELGFQ